MEPTEADRLATVEAQIETLQAGMETLQTTIAVLAAQCNNSELFIQGLRRNVEAIGVDVSGLRVRVAQLEQ